MEIVHQKLVMLLACSATAVFAFRLNFESMTDGGFIVRRIRLGLSIIIAGSILGIVGRIGIIGNWLYTTSLGFFVETIIGFMFGWAIIIWALLDWSKEHFDGNGKPLVSSRQRRFSDRLTEELLKDHDLNSLLESISRYLLQALDCQALSLHRKNHARGLVLQFQYGLKSDSADLIKYPSKSNKLFNMVLPEKQAVTGVEMHSMGLDSTLLSKNGAIVCAFTIPIVLDEQFHALLTVYSARSRQFTLNDLDLLHRAVSAIAQALRNEKIREDLRIEGAKKHLISELSDIFDSGESLLDSFLKASKFIRKQQQFDDLSLYIPENGPVNILDFPLPEGGNVYQKTGFFPKSDYPQLYGRRKESPTDYSNIMSYSRSTRNYSSFILRIGHSTAPMAHLEIGFHGYIKIPDMIISMAKTLAFKISQRLDSEMATARIDQNAQRLAALQYAAELAFAKTDMQAFFEEMAKIAVSATSAEFCNIILSNPEKTSFNVVASLNTQPHNSPMPLISEIPIDSVVLHRNAFLENRKLYFGLGVSDLSITNGDKACLLPDNVTHGIIIPLISENHPVGLLTVGQTTGKSVGCPLETDSFIFNLALIVSMALSLRADRHPTGKVREGARKLTIRQNAQSVALSNGNQSLNLKSRLNGPLAGIMASCEYLRGSHQAIGHDVSRYLDIIERNAAKINGIASGLSEEIGVLNDK